LNEGFGVERDTNSVLPGGGGSFTVGLIVAHVAKCVGL